MSLYLRKFTLFNWNCSSKIIFPNFEIFNLACSKRTCAFIFFTGFLARARPLLPSYARKAGFKFLSLSLFLSLFLSFSLSLSFFLSFSLSLWSPHLYVSLMDGRRKCRSKPRHKNKFETTLCQFFQIEKRPRRRLAEPDVCEIDLCLIFSVWKFEQKMSKVPCFKIIDLSSLRYSTI